MTAEYPGRRLALAAGASLAAHGLALAGMLLLPDSRSIPALSLHDSAVNVVWMEAASPAAAATPPTPVAVTPRELALTEPSPPAPPQPAPRPRRVAVEAPAPIPTPEPETPGEGEAEAAPSTLASLPVVAPSTATAHAASASPSAESGGAWSVLSRVDPAYPAVARKRGREGEVLLRAEIDAGGVPLRIRVHQSSGFTAFDSAAIEAVARWRFRNERPLTVEIPIAFRLQQQVAAQP